MKKMSGIAKAVRTSLADLEALELSDAELARVGGGLSWGGGGPIIGGGGGVFEGGHCWQSSTSASAPGDPDTAQDWVVD